MIGPPTFFVGLMSAPGFSRQRVESLRLISSGGAGVTAAFVEQASDAFGARVKRTYGSTEAPTVTTSTPRDSVERARETDGRVTGAAELRVSDPDTGRALPAGEAGELWLRGPELFVGYAAAEQTRAAIRRGWFRTGDLATVDADGWLTIVGRMKDVIIRAGENIAAAEVEGILEAHPDVRQAAVVGEPDARLGERVCAFVVASAPFDLAECRAWFEKQGVAVFKTPERVVQLDELPAPRRRQGRPRRAETAGGGVLALARELPGVLDVGGAAVLRRVDGVAASRGAAGDLHHVVPDRGHGHLEVGADDLRAAPQREVAAGHVVGARLDEVGVGAGADDEALLHQLPGSVASSGSSTLMTAADGDSFAGGHEHRPAPRATGGPGGTRRGSAPPVLRMTMILPRVLPSVGQPRPGDGGAQGLRLAAHAVGRDELTPERLADDGVELVEPGGVEPSQRRVDDEVDVVVLRAR